MISAISSSLRSADRIADGVVEDGVEEGMAIGALPRGVAKVELFKRPRARRLPARELLDALWLAKEVLDVR